MSVQRSFTVEQKRELVYAYIAQPYGTKTRFLQEQGLRKEQMRTWRSQVFADTLELGLVPRGGTMVSTEESAALARLVRQNEALQEKLDTTRAKHERALADKDAELATQRRVVDALGKAIEILHHSSSASKISTSGTEPGAHAGQDADGRPAPG